MVGGTARTARDQFHRVACLFVGTGAMAFALLTGSAMIAQTPLASPWWTPSAYVATFGPAVLMIVAAARWQLVVARTAVVGFAIGYAVGLLSWLPAQTGMQIGHDETLWVVWLPGLPALAMSIFWKRAPFVYLAIMTGICQLATAMVRTGPQSATALVADWMFAFTYSALPCAGIIGMVGAGTLLDVTAGSAVATAMSSAAAQAKRIERQRIDMLTHDGVIATLLQASLTCNSPALAAHARQTLDELDHLADGGSPTDETSVAVLTANIRAMAASIDDSVEVDSSGNNLHVPHPVATALLAAAGEAVRNWQRHAGTAGTPSHCWITVTAGVTGVCVDVIDDGVGFDPATVPTERIGLRASITNRMADLPNGWSVIDSRQGSGTRISVGWHR